MALGPSPPMQDRSLVLLATSCGPWLWVRGSCSALARILHGAWDRHVLGGRSCPAALQPVNVARQQLVGSVLEV